MSENQAGELFGSGLAALSSLGAVLESATASRPAAPPLPLPDLPWYTRPMDRAVVSGPDGLRYLRERSAGRGERYDERMRLMELEFALDAAREGRLDPDWREQGLASALAAVAAGRPGHAVWVWQKIADQGPDVWEPRGFAAYVDAYAALPNLAFPLWRVPLTRWYSIVLEVKSSQEQIDPVSASRWAGVDLVRAWRVGDQAAWDAVLDRYEGSWPALAAYNGPWSQSLCAHQLLCELDHIELSYEIGLASGGVSIDWRDNHIRRVQRWRMAGAREAALAHLELLSPDTCLFRLPGYWRDPRA